MQRAVPALGVTPEVGALERQRAGEEVTGVRATAVVEVGTSGEVGDYTLRVVPRVHGQPEPVIPDVVHTTCKIRQEPKSVSVLIFLHSIGRVVHFLWSVQVGPA